MSFHSLLINPRVLIFGVLSWALPFVMSFFFFTPQGELLVAQPLFKSLMVVLGGGVGVFLLMLTFKRIQPSVVTGVSIGVLWLLINWFLDALILLPMSGMSMGEYMYDIGLRYLLIPIISTAMGVVAEQQQ